MTRGMLLPARPALPAAARLQLDVTEADHRLTAAVRLQRWSVAWWWGVRQMGASNLAVCYHCGGYLATWRRFRAPSDANMRAVRAHRAVALRALGLDPGTDAAGISPAADTAPKGVTP